MTGVDADSTAGRIRPQILGNGVLWSFLGHGIPLVVALAAIPALIAGYGTDRFGVLALIWAAVSYFGLFDLGMGRALTQLVARGPSESAGGDRSATLWTALALMGVLGGVGGGVLALLTPWLVNDVLAMPEELRGETQSGFLLVAIFVPLLTIGQGLSGILEGHLRFGIVNAVRIPLGAIALLGPVALLSFTDSLVPAVGAMLVARIIGVALYLYYCLQTVPAMRRSFRISRRSVLPVLRFGSWMTISNAIGPLMVYFDRFVIGALASVTATAYYAAPYDLITRLWIVPGALSSVLFPAFAFASRADPDRVPRLYGSGLKCTIIFLSPLVFLIVAFAGEILAFWLGADFADESARVLQILALGVLINSAAQISFALVQGFGRADLTAKFHLAEAPFYTVFLWWAVSNYGIEGAAAAWTLRATADAVLLFVAVRHLAGCAPVLIMRSAAALTTVSTMAVLVADVDDPATRCAVAGAVLAIFLSSSWTLLLSADERRSIFGVLGGQFRRTIRVGPRGTT